MSSKRIHPSPFPSSSSFPTYLSCLPTALLALASTLSPQEQEVLSYLLDSEKPKNKKAQKKRPKSHAPDLGCSCFECYKSFWERWDSSPNRHVIHLILDELESKLEDKETGKACKGKSKKKKTARKMDKKLADVVKKDDVCGDDEEACQNDEEAGFVNKLFGWLLWN